MARKVFISVLGTNRYVKTKYYFGNCPSNNNDKLTHFVQEAILRHECFHWNKDDIGFIFLTDEAKKENWGEWVKKTNTAEGYKGLSKIIEELDLPFTIEGIDIPKGLDEKELWEIFRIVYEKLQKGDELYFDITHSFRSIPMLVMVLINYAKFLKEINVAKIFYGAFENLGPARLVEHMPENERNAPVLDLTTFSELQDWTSAAHEFLSFGYSKNFGKTVKNYIAGLPENEKIRKRNYEKIFNESSSIFTTLRGKNLIGGKEIKQLREVLDILKNRSDIPALKPIIFKVDKKISKFKERDINNGFIAIEWCIEHKLVQQAITLSQEMIITYLCYLWREKYALDYRSKEDRESLSSLFGVVNNNTDVPQWKGSLKNNQEVFIEIKDEKLFKNFVKVYNQLLQIRNSINHAGFVGDLSAQIIEKKFLEYYQEMKKIINNQDNVT